MWAQLMTKTSGTAALAITLLLVVICLVAANAATEEAPPSSNASGVSLHVAALQGDLDSTLQHIQAGSDLNQKDAYGSTPLIIATTFGNTEVARALLEAGADMEIGNNEGSTPLHLAAFFGRTEIAEALLDKGADRYRRSDDGATAFDITAAPLDDDRWLYERIEEGLAPLGFQLDYEQIETARPRIAEMLRPPVEDLQAIEYAPLPGEGWEVSTPEERGLDPMLVAQLYLDAGEMETLYGLLVIKDDDLIAEKYFNDGAREQQALLQSVTKSFTSALVGIALAEGCLTGLDQKMLEFFPERADQVTDPRKRQITVRQMLQMRAGYPWEETDLAYWQALLTGDYLPRMVEFPLTRDPGTEFQYSNMTSHWLGVIVARACNTDLRSYAQEKLFDPMGATAGSWLRDPYGYYFGQAELHLTARDVAKFGLLYLNDGLHEGRQLVPVAWVRESLHSYSEEINSAGIRSSRVGRYFRDIGYGYQWWSARVGEHRFNLAWGHGGQFVVLLHELDMVIVTTAYPFHIQHDDEAWKHERATINLLGKFIQSLPVE